MSDLAVHAGYHTGHYPAKTKKQAQNSYAGIGNQTEVFGANAVSAKQAVSSIFCDLAHPFVDGADTEKKSWQYQEAKKDFYRAFLEEQKNNVEAGDTKSEEEESVDYRKFLREKTEELYVRFQKGELEPTYQIGAASFTEKEWDKLLEKFDAIQEEMRAQMREEHEKREQKAEENLRQTTLLNSTYTQSIYPQQNEQEEPVHYITCYTEEGIFCRKAGSLEGYEWSIRFQNPEEYDRVMQFINQFPADSNLPFTSHENFFRDFLDNKIDVDAFTQFILETENGVPDYTITKGDSTYIDRDKIQWAKYMMDQDFGTFHTAQEMEQMQAEEIAKNQEGLHKLSDLYGNIYRLSHPEYRGERMFCEFLGGPLYTADEIGKRMYENYLKQMQTV
ncbi:MAG: hypothetical protein K2N63_06065 [Lachnospiraceae bacterium]|nr:hypothetical protein [Lachnospiraceae bacterium]